MARRGIYVETVIAADLDRVWEATQSPADHVRWDLRFSSIVPEDAPEKSPTRFVYERRVPFHVIRGDGVSLGERRGRDGGRTSALRFTTSDRVSPLRSGRGYWRYTPSPRGTVFVTGFDYEPGWGVLDVVVRPLVGWATAWSFDRLRIWVETGAAPETWPLRSVLWWWRPDRPRARRCRRSPFGPPGGADRLDDAPASLASLPDPRRAS